MLEILKVLHSKPGSSVISEPQAQIFQLTVRLSASHLIWADQPGLKQQRFFEF